MSYFRRSRDDDDRRLPSYRETNGFRKSRRKCYGQDYNPHARECRETCPDRSGCREECGYSRVNKPKKQEVAVRSAADDDDSDYEELEAPAGTSLAKVYAHNATLGAVEAALDEGLFMFKTWPRYKYPHGRKKKE
jgi:hypothetical protein